MPVHNEQKIFPYTPEQMFDLVADVADYENFLPWCLKSKITKQAADGFYADLVIGFKVFREKFTSRVYLDRPDSITVEYLSGPLAYLTNEWKFAPEPDGQGCEIHFHLDFEFRSRVFQKIMGVFFTEAVHRMVSAFEKRANEIYGCPEGALSAG